MSYWNDFFYIQGTYSSNISSILIDASSILLDIMVILTNISYICIYTNQIFIDINSIFIDTISILCSILQLNLIDTLAMFLSKSYALISLIFILQVYYLEGSFHNLSSEKYLSIQWQALRQSVVSMQTYLIKTIALNNFSASVGFKIIDLTLIPM